MPSRDRVYAQPLSEVGDFQFDDSVADVFEDMIHRSVPGYGSILAMIPTLAERFVRPNTAVYDLGCSLGAVTLAMLPFVPPSCRIHAIDQSPAMIDRLDATLGNPEGVSQRLLGEHGPEQNSPEQGGPEQSRHKEALVETHLADIRDIAVTGASFVSLNFTLQFIPLADREALLVSIAGGLLPGGALLLSEKICLPDSTEQSLLTDLHHEFKRARGYSDLEISQKRAALENTLIPETLETHIDRLKSAGFGTVVPWFSCLGFASLLAVK